MERKLRWQDYITININWFAITARSQVLTPLVVPLLIQQFVGEANKGTALGNLRLWALMAALLIQALIGMLSDRNTSHLGRRRPFIIIGVTLEIIVITLIGFSAQLEGSLGYWVLFVLYIISMAGANISHAATQGFIPDLVPDEKKGLASGIKAIFELPLPLIFTSFVLAKMIERGNLWGGLIGLLLVMMISAAITMLVPEKPISPNLPKINWTPLIRLLIMTGVFTILILGTGWGVKKFLVLAVNLSNRSSVIVSGLIGILGMGIAVFLGVLASLKISLGDEFRTHKSFLWWVINRLLFLVAANNLAGFMVFFLQEKFPEYSGLDIAGPAAKIIMYVGIFILLFALPSGWLADKFGKKLLCGAAGILVGIGAAIVIFSPEITGLIYIGASIAGAGLGLFYSANWALGTELVPADKAGQFLGLSNLAGAGAGAIGAYIGGPIGDLQSYILLMVIFGTMAVLSIGALFGISEIRG
jgi:Na+/melibiose symporter-like transporter